MFVIGKCLHHPPSPLPQGRGKKNIRVYLRDTLRLPAKGRCPSALPPDVGGCTIPLSPILLGRGKKNMRVYLRDTLRLPVKGLRPSALPPDVGSCTIPLSPILPHRKGEEEYEVYPERHPQAPGKGAAPLLPPCCMSGQVRRLPVLGRGGAPLLLDGAA